MRISSHGWSGSGSAPKKAPPPAKPKVDESKFVIRINEQQDHWAWTVFYSTDLRNSATHGTQSTEGMAKHDAERWVTHRRSEAVRLTNLKPGYSYEF